MTTTSSGGGGASSADEIGSVTGWYRGGRAGESGSTSDHGCRGGVADRRAAGGLGDGVESEEMTMISGGGGGGGGGAGGAVITALARAAASRSVQFIAERGSRRGTSRGRMLNWRWNRALSRPPFFFFAVFLTLAISILFNFITEFYYYLIN